jgi:threonine dehydrogenase-like Zn-dependent dehydrogenase
MAFAKHRGAKVIAMDINDERLQFCKSWAGVDFTVNALNAPQESLAESRTGNIQRLFLMPQAMPDRWKMHSNMLLMVVN